MIEKFDISFPIRKILTSLKDKCDKVFKSGLSKFFEGCLLQNLLSPL